MKSPAILLLIAFFLIPAVCCAEQFHSTGKQVSVLELYTSEGCSSCPPADRWMSTLKNDKRLWKELIPVAFHVDYWNYIGWTDRFSMASYSERQRNYAHYKGLSTVYTPGFVLNGREWRSFFGLRRLKLDPQRDTGDLLVKVDQQNVAVTYQSSGVIVKKPMLNIAILGFDLKTRVQAGENHGKELNHDFTVLGFRTIPMLSTENGFVVNTELPETSVKADRTGLAVWINEGDDPTPLQATGGYLGR